ncbi:MAG: T9SS type A sorting domain-containing protein [Muribaculaceae bacterium]
MKKYISAIIMALAVCLSAAAADATHSVVVKAKSGTETEFKFADEPFTYFADGQIVFSANNGLQSLFLDVADFESFYFKTAEGGVTDAELQRATFTLTPDAISAEHLAPNAAVKVFNVAGVELLCATTDANGAVNLSITDLAAGTYVLSAGNYSFKFTK